MATKKDTKAVEAKESTAIVPVEEGGFVILADEEARGMLAEVKPGPADLNKLLVPAGKSGAFFTIETLEGEEAAQALDVVVAWESPMERAFYATSIDEGDSGPPHCSSSNSVEGFGVRDVAQIQAGKLEELEPTKKACADCVFSEYGSALNGGKGQACSQRVRLIVFDTQNILPLVLQIPAMSLKPLKQYKMRLLNGRKRLSRTVTRISLAKQKGNMDFYTIEFERVRDLTGGEAEQLGGLAKMLSEAATAS